MGGTVLRLMQGTRVPHVDPRTAAFAGQVAAAIGDPWINA